MLNKLKRKTIYDAQKALDDLKKGKKPEKLAKKLMKKSKNIEIELMELFKKQDKILTQFFKDIDITNQFIDQCLDCASIEMLEMVIDQVDVDEIKKSEKLVSNEELILEMRQRSLLSDEDIRSIYKKNKMSSNFMLNVFESLDKEDVKHLVTRGIDLTHMTVELFSNAYMTYQEFQQLIR